MGSVLLIALFLAAGMPSGVARHAPPQDPVKDPQPEAEPAPEPGPEPAGQTGSAPQPEPEPEPEPSTTNPNAPPAERDDEVALTLASYRSSGSFPALEDALRALALRHPDRLSLWEIGRSPGGRPILMAVLREPGVAETVAGAPGVLVLPELARESAAGPEAALATLLELLEEGSGLVEDFDRPIRWFILPAPWPDRLVGAGEPSSVPERPDGSGRTDLDRNFPGWWDPAYGSGGAAGPHPLSRPESAALARFLIETPELAAVLVHRGGRGGPRPSSAPAPPAAPDREALAVLDRALAPFGGRSLGEEELTAGSFSLFAFDHRGLYAASSWPWSPLPGDARAVGPAHREQVRWRLRTAGQLARALAAQLPRLELGGAEVRPLGEDLWQVDLPVANRGALPTLSAAARRRGIPGDLTLACSGGTLVAAACRRGDEVYHQVLKVDGGSVLVTGLDGGAVLSLRLIVSAPSGDSVRLVLSAPRAGEASLAIALP